MLINNLPLPQHLIDLIAEGRWKTPDDKALLRQVTGNPDLNPTDFFLRPTAIERENAANILLAQDEAMCRIYGLDSSNRTGKPITNPEILDVDKAIIICCSYDEDAVCLDYRASMEEPQVVASTGEGSEPLRWKVIAPNFKHFAEQLGL